jgi:prepilin-type N-terminal cleavage/methylation domain-containing protein
MHRRAREAGFSLIELLIVVTMIGILTAMVAPGIRRAMLRNNVIGARNALANMYTTARLTGLQTTRNVVLKRVGDVVHIAAWPRRDNTGGPLARDTIGAVVDLNNRYGVTLTPASGSLDSLLLNPKGFGAANLTWVVARAGFTDSVRINNLGVIVR